MNITPTEQDLLREIANQIYNGSGFPNKAKFRVQHVNERGALNALAERGFLDDKTNDYIITPKGLLACNSLASKQILERCNVLLYELKDLYRQDALNGTPSQQRTISELFKSSMKIPTEQEHKQLAQTLTIFYAAWSPVSAAALFEYKDGTPGLVSKVTLFEGILDVKPFAETFERALNGNYEATTSPARLTISVENFRSLRSFHWSPEGVCVLVGPNGSGKTTALQLIECLRRGLNNGFVAGLDLFGPGPFRHLDATPEMLCSLKLSLGELTWLIQPERSYRVHERVRSGSTDLVTRARGDAEMTTLQGAKYQANDEMALARASKADAATARQVDPLVSVVQSSRYYSKYRLDLLREAGSAQSRDVKLETDGRNLFSVLRNWRDSNEHQHRWGFVNDNAASIFEGWYKRLDFDSLAQRVSASVIHTKWREKLTPTDWSDGFFTTLLHLTAIASADKGGILAIDEPETTLHPALIQSMLKAMRDWSADQNVTILLASHSPVVLDQFKEEPEQVFVMEPGREELPVALDKLKKRDWLAHYSLGDLYAHLEVGAPVGLHS